MRQLTDTELDLVVMKKMTAEELDATAIRIDSIEREACRLRDQLKAQVETYGFTPPRAEKSKRLKGELYQFTVSTSTTVEIRDTAVMRIAERCPEKIFSKLFQQVTKWKLCGGAMALLAGRLPDEAPRNLRKLFQEAIVLKENSPRLTIKQVGDTEAEEVSA